MKNTPRFASRLRWTVLFAAVGAVGLGLGVWLNALQHPSVGRLQAPGATLSATVLPRGKPLKPFRLVDQNDRPFTLDALKGHWSFLFFGYTHCPDVCPSTLQVLHGVDTRLRPAGQTPQFVFISVDPDRDTPARLGKYVAYFDPAFVGATGTADQIDALTNQLGILYGFEDPDPKTGDYAVSHSAQILLVDPSGALRAVFSPPQDAAAISADFRKIRDSYKG